MNVELMPEFKHRKEVHGRWKKGKASSEQQSPAIQNSELKQARKVKDSKRGFCTYAISKRQVKENTVLLCICVEDLETKGIEKDDVLNAIFLSVFAAKVCSQAAYVLK